MFKLISVLFLAILNLLPSSPFQTTVDGAIYKLDFLSYLNWFIPFDNCLKVTRLWIVCIGIYYLYNFVKKIGVDFILSNLFKL